MAPVSQALATAIAHHRAGRLDLAAEVYRRILAVEPEHAAALELLGVVAHQQGQHAEAVDYIRRALTLCPTAAPYHNNLGDALQALQKIPEAIAAYQRAVELDPRLPEAHWGLGRIWQQQGKLAEAARCYQRSIELKPDFTAAHNNLGNVRKDQGQLEEAVACYQRAIALRPDLADAHNNLGVVLRRLGRLDAAVASCRQAVVLRPDFAAAHNNLGLAVEAQGRITEAVASFQRALELQPDFANAHNNLALALANQGRIEEAIGHYQRALTLNPRYPLAHSNYLLCLQYLPQTTLASLAAAHRQWNDQHAAVLRDAAPPVVHDRTPDRPLRLGFVSPDFGRHPVGWFVVRVLEELRRQACPTVCYSDRNLRDELTARIEAAAGVWRDVRSLSHEALAERIRADRIDILFDLAGHAGSSRLLTFARKPAPVQIAWIGYPGTTGLSAMDYLLADRWQVPAEDEWAYCEHVLRLPDGYVCYAPPAYAPETGPLPALTQGTVTLACFGNPGKIGPSVVALWSRILHRLPQARLALQYKGMNDAAVVARLTAAFVAQAIDPRRLTFRGRAPHEDLLRQYQHVDLALDTFPYSGGLTTCEALWMGVPVVTCPGQTFAGRHSLSHLATVGLTETVAHDPDEYVELAVTLGRDLPRLAAMRAGLRAQMAASPLCDGPRFAQNLLNALHLVWRR